MLMVLATAWLLVQPPWWEKPGDFPNMVAELEGGGGYEGTDEYLPNDGDAYEIRPDAPLVRLEDSGRARIQTQEWSAEEKSFTANVSQPGNLVLRLFSYPAWQTEVNGQVVETDDQDYTGQLRIPVDAGENRVRVRFTRTRDRIFGDIISGITALLMLALLVWQRRRRLRHPKFETVPLRAP
jgi:hypothetical protein